MSNFKPMKFKVESPEHSRMIQEVLFSIGCRWTSLDRKVMYTSEKYLYTNSLGLMLKGSNHSDFLNETAKEYKLINGKLVESEESNMVTIQLTYAEAWEKLKEGKKVFYNCLNVVHQCILENGFIKHSDVFAVPFHPTDKLFTMKKEPDYEILGLHDDFVEVEVFGLKTYQRKYEVVIYYINDRGFVYVAYAQTLIGQVKFKGDCTKAKIIVTVDKDGNVTKEYLS